MELFPEKTFEAPGEDSQAEERRFASLLQGLQRTVLTAVCHSEPRAQPGDQLSCAAPSAAITAQMVPFRKCLGTLILRQMTGSLEFIVSLFLQPS